MGTTETQQPGNRRNKGDPLHHPGDYEPEEPKLDADTRTKRRKYTRTKHTQYLWRLQEPWKKTLILKTPDQFLTRSKNTQTFLN